MYRCRPDCAFQKLQARIRFVALLHAAVNSVEAIQSLLEIFVHQTEIRWRNDLINLTTKTCRVYTTCKQYKSTT